MAPRGHKPRSSKDAGGHQERQEAGRPSPTAFRGSLALGPPHTCSFCPRLLAQEQPATGSKAWGRSCLLAPAHHTPSVRKFYSKGYPESSSSSAVCGPWPGPALTISPGWSPARPQQCGPSQWPSCPSSVPALQGPLTSLRVKAHVCPRPSGPACPLTPRGSFMACPLAFPPWLQCHLSLRPPLISKFKCDGKMERLDPCKAPSGMPGSDSAGQ